MLSFGSVNLWAIERQDLGQHYQWANDESLCRLAGASTMPRSMATLERWYGGLQSDPRQEVFSIKDAEAHMLGWVHLQDLDERCGSACLGIVIDPNYWGRGFAYEALAAMMGYAFEDRRLNRLQAEILSMNKPSKALFLKLGFSHEGTRRQAYFGAGRYLDIEIYGLLLQEYRRPRSYEQADKSISVDA